MGQPKAWHLPFFISGSSVSPMHKVVAILLRPIKCHNTNVHKKIPMLMLISCRLPQGNPICFWHRHGFCCRQHLLIHIEQMTLNLSMPLALGCPIELEDKQLFWFFPSCFIAVVLLLYSQKSGRNASRTVPEAMSTERPQGCFENHLVPSNSCNVSLSKLYQWSSWS